MNNKGFSSVIIGWVIVIVIIFLGTMFILKFMETGKFFWFLNDEETVENDFFTTDYVGTYYNNKFGETTQNCTKSGNNYNCKLGTNVEFYVGITNKGEKKRYFYPAPCIIKDYSKGDKCESSDYIVSFRPCGIDPALPNATNCALGRGFTLETGTYRVFPGAKCLPEECYDPENPTTNDPKANYASFFEITVK